MTLLKVFYYSLRLVTWMMVAIACYCFSVPLAPVLLVIFLVSLGLKVLLDIGDAVLGFLLPFSFNSLVSSLHSLGQAGCVVLFLLALIFSAPLFVTWGFLLSALMYLFVSVVSVLVPLFFELGGEVNDDIRMGIDSNINDFLEKNELTSRMSRMISNRIKEKVTNLKKLALVVSKGQYEALEERKEELSKSENADDKKRAKVFDNILKGISCVILHDYFVPCDKCDECDECDSMLPIRLTPKQKEAVLDLEAYKGAVLDLNTYGGWETICIKNNEPPTNPMSREKVKPEDIQMGYHRTQVESFYGFVLNDLKLREQFGVKEELGPQELKNEIDKRCNNYVKQQKACQLAYNNLR